LCGLVVGEYFDVTALFAAIDEKRIREGLTWSGVAQEIERRFAKVSPSTIKRISKKSRVEGDGVLQMLLWLDRTPESFVPGFHGPEERLRAPSGSNVLRWDTAKIFREIDRKRERSCLTWKETADQIGGMTPRQLMGLAKGGRTFLPEIMRVLAWLGISAGTLTKESAT
jgi:hypothetical protein